MQRYISNIILNAIYRPQPYNYCSIQSLRTVYKVLNYAEISIDEILHKSGVDHETVIKGRVGNKLMSQIAEFIGFRLEIVGSSSELFSWEQIKTLIDTDTPMIFHREGHYCNICGYIEEPKMIKGELSYVPLGSTEISAWIVLAEHRVKGKTGIDDGMIELFSLEKFKQELDKNPNTALLIPYRL